MAPRKPASRKSKPAATPRRSSRIAELRRKSGNESAKPRPVPNKHNRSNTQRPAQRVQVRIPDRDDDSLTATPEEIEALRRKILANPDWSDYWANRQREQLELLTNPPPPVAPNITTPAAAAAAKAAGLVYPLRFCKCRYSKQCNAKGGWSHNRRVTELKRNCNEHRLARGECSQREAAQDQHRLMEIRSAGREAQWALNSLE